MARIRTIKPEFWTSEQVMNCSPMARLLFIGIWNFCDDAGNHVASAKTIKANVFPGDDISSTDVQLLLDELSSNSLICFYAQENKRYLHVTGWHHQKIDKPTYKHPAYKPGENDEKSDPPRRVLAESSPPEGMGSGMEGKGKEGETTTEPPPASREGNPASSSPPPAPDEASRRNVQIAVLIRRNGGCHSTHPDSKGIAELVTSAATDVEILTSLEKAKRQRKDANSAQPVTAAYLLPIVLDARNKPTEKPKGRFAEDLQQMKKLSEWADEQMRQQGQSAPSSEIDMGAIDASRND